MAFHDNLKGAMLMAVAMAGFTINDAMVRIVTPDMNPGQIMFIRGALTSVLIVAIAWKMNAFMPLRTSFNPLLLVRTTGEIMGSITYVTALAYLPLSNAASILQALPLAVTLGAALFLGEKVGWRRWLAIAIGFAGVLIVIRPGADGFNAASLLVVGSVLSAAIRDIATKRIDRNIPSLYISAVAAVSITLIGALLVVPYGGWRPVGLHHLGLMGFGACMLFAGYQAVIMSMRTSEISFIAPFRYTSLLWSIFMGIFVLGEWPDRWMLIGASVIIFAGLYSFYRESRLRRIAAAGAEGRS